MDNRPVPGATYSALPLAADEPDNSAFVSAMRKLALALLVILLTVAIIAGAVYFF